MIGVEPHVLTREEARRIAVRAAHLDVHRPGDVLELARGLAMVRVELTTTVLPAADHSAWSRIGSGYRCADIPRAVTQGLLFERGWMLRPMSDLGLYLASAPRRNHGSADLSAALKDTHHDGFVFSASAGDLAGANVFVHVPGLAADEGFIRFDLLRQLIDASDCEGVPNAMIHEPGRLLAHADHAMHFIRTDAVAVVHNLPHCGKPLIQTKRAVFENGSGLDGELTARVASAALPAVVLRHERNVLTAASRALNTVRPAARNDPLAAVLLIGKEDYRFLQSGGFHS